MGTWTWADAVREVRLRESRRRTRLHEVFGQSREPLRFQVGRHGWKCGGVGGDLTSRTGKERHWSVLEVTNMHEHEKK
jgi:hypothetical protein